MSSSWHCRSWPSIAFLTACVVLSGCEEQSPPDPRFNDLAAQRPNDSKKLTVVFVDGVPVPAESAPAAMAARPGGPPMPPKPPTQAQVRWKVPTRWVSVPPSSQVRLAEYRVPGEEPDATPAEVAVFYLGPALTVPVEDTLRRWGEAFESVTADGAKRSSRPVGAYTAHLLEVSGTYKDSSMMARDGQNEPKPGWMLLGAVVETPAGPYYFKFLGPQKVVRAGRQEFEVMIDSVGESSSPVSSAPAVSGSASTTSPPAASSAR